jgi:ribosomal protein S27AE
MSEGLEGLLGFLAGFGVGVCLTGWAALYRLKQQLRRLTRAVDQECPGCGAGSFQPHAGACPIMRAFRGNVQ